MELTMLCGLFRSPPDAGQPEDEISKLSPSKYLYQKPVGTGKGIHRPRFYGLFKHPLDSGRTNQKMKLPSYHRYIPCQAHRE